MNKRHIPLSISAVLAASVLAWAPHAIGAGNTNTHDRQDARGVPGVELNVGSNASDRGLPGVEMNIGRDGDQNNIDTRTLGAGTDLRSGTGASTDLRYGTDGSTARPMRLDRG